MILAIIMLVVAIALSAFFSGSETGFYRVTKVRLVLDGLQGDWIAKGLLWLTNRPSLFVATVLVGNNIANYMASLAVIVGIEAVYTGSSHLPELVAPILLSPLVFVYGELLPKNLFYHAPYRLLRACGPMLLGCMVLFTPISLILWGMSKLLQLLLGEMPQKVQSALVRRELQRVLEEGHEAGILVPAQRSLVQGLLSLAARPVRQFATPAARIARGSQEMSIVDLQRLARRHRLAAIPVEKAKPGRGLAGYVRTIDLYLHKGEQTPLRPLVDIPERETFIAALIRLQRAGESMGRIVDPRGDVVGFVTTRQLSKLLFQVQ